MLRRFCFPERAHLGRSDSAAPREIVTMASDGPAAAWKAALRTAPLWGAAGCLPPWRRVESTVRIRSTRCGLEGRAPDPLGRNRHIATATSESVCAYGSGSDRIVPSISLQTALFLALLRSSCGSFASA